MANQAAELNVVSELDFLVIGSERNAAKADIAGHAAADSLIIRADEAAKAHKSVDAALAAFFSCGRDIADICGHFGLIAVYHTNVIADEATDIEVELAFDELCCRGIDNKGLVIGLVVFVIFCIAVGILELAHGDADIADIAQALTCDCADGDGRAGLVIRNTYCDLRVNDLNIGDLAVLINSVGKNTCGRGRIKLCAVDDNIADYGLVAHCTEDAVRKRDILAYGDRMDNIIRLCGVFQPLEIIECCRFIECCRWAHREAMGLLKALCDACKAEVGVDVRKLVGSADFVGCLFILSRSRPVRGDLICKRRDEHMHAVVKAVDHNCLGDSLGAFGILRTGPNAEVVCCKERTHIG